MYRLLASLTLALAGVIHIFIAPHHIEHAPVYGLLFVFSGMAQVSWALAVWLRLKRRLYYAGLALSGGLVVMWSLVQMWTPAFATMPASVDGWIVTSKAAEAVGFLALLGLARQRQRSNELPIARPTRLFIEALAVALVAGLLFYGAGYAAEPLLPR